MQLQSIRNFFHEKYPFAIDTKSRKREIVMQRRMIVNFLFNECKMSVGSIKIILRKNHQIPSYFICKKVHDLEYAKFYELETEKFRIEFMELLKK